MGKDEILPEILAAAGVCAEFCARPEVWPAFEEWLLEDGVPADENFVSREFLLTASRVVLMLIRQMETELIAEKFRLLLSEN